MRMMKRSNSIQKYGIPGIFCINIAIIIGFWWTVSHKLLLSGDASSMLLAFGRLTGLLAVLFVLLQFLLMGRPVWIEKIFGLDKLARIHHLNGYLSISFILLHPVLLITSYAIRNEVGLIEQYVDFFHNYRDVWQASIAVILFTGIVFLSITIARKRLKYESWYFIHLLTYLAVLLAFGHQLKIGGDLLTNKSFAAYWWMLYIFVFGNVLIFRFMKPVYNSVKYRFTVSDVVAETADTNSVYITGRNLHKFRTKAGQFIILRFLAKGFWWQAHPFSLSFVPKNNQIRITVKNCGDFTSKIPEIKKGTPLYIDGPYGVFTPKPEQDIKYLFIAGGVGITPIRTMIERVAEEHDLILLYGNKKATDIIFRKELDELKTKHDFPVHHILSDQPDYEGEKGRIDKEKLLRLVKDIKEREIYICGPVPMMDGIIKLLRETGVKRERIHFEKFSL